MLAAVLQELFLLPHSKPLRWIFTGLLHLDQFITIPRPTTTTFDELMALSAREVEISAANTPTLNIAVVLVEFVAGDMTRRKNLEHFLVGIEDQPRPNAAFVTEVIERHAPAMFLHTTTNLV
jgi:hypothetical protein